MAYALVDKNSIMRADRLPSLLWGDSFIRLANCLVQIARIQTDKSDISVRRAAGTLCRIGCNFFTLARILSNNGACATTIDSVRIFARCWQFLSRQARHF